MVSGLPHASNELDDDGDGITDFPGDPGCSAAGDDDESDPQNPPACGNQVDDDQDGLVDYPNDPGCAGVGDRDESDPESPPRCADGVDNDRDGLVDYPRTEVVIRQPTTARVAHAGVPLMPLRLSRALSFEAIHGRPLMRLKALWRTGRARGGFSLSRVTSH